LYEQRAFEAGSSLHVERQDLAWVFQGLTAKRQHDRLPLAKAPQVVVRLPRAPGWILIKPEPGHGNVGVGLELAHIRLAKVRTTGQQHL
jgi:hypothetical protein